MHTEELKIFLEWETLNQKKLLVKTIGSKL